MITIAITSPEIRELKGIAKVSGRPYHLRIQTGYAFTVSPEGVISDFPDKFEITLDADQPPYLRGKYQLQPSSVFVNRDGRLDIRTRLTPLASSKTV